MRHTRLLWCADNWPVYEKMDVDRRIDNLLSRHGPPPLHVLPSSLGYFRGSGRHTRRVSSALLAFSRLLRYRRAIWDMDRRRGT